MLLIFSIFALLALSDSGCIKKVQKNASITTRQPNKLPTQKSIPTPSVTSWKQPVPTPSPTSTLKLIPTLSPTELLTNKPTSSQTAVSTDMPTPSSSLKKKRIQRMKFAYPIPPTGLYYNVQDASLSQMNVSMKRSRLRSKRSSDGDHQTEDLDGEAEEEADCPDNKASTIYYTAYSIVMIFVSTVAVFQF